jgi:hypothetical protein
MTDYKRSPSPSPFWNPVKTDPESACINPELLNIHHDPEGNQVDCYSNPASTTEDVKQSAKHECVAMDGCSTPLAAIPSLMDGSDHLPVYSDTDQETPGSFVDVKIEEASSPTEAFNQLCLTTDYMFAKKEAATPVAEMASEKPTTEGIIEPIVLGASNKKPAGKLSPATARRKAASAQEPYAKLIHRALLSKSDYCMSLQELYQWFRENTDRAKNERLTGWQNSIRHNLSMNHVSRYHVSVYIFSSHHPMSAFGFIMAKASKLYMKAC